MIDWLANSPYGVLAFAIYMTLSVLLVFLGFGLEEIGVIGERPGLWIAVSPLVFFVVFLGAELFASIWLQAIRDIKRRGSSASRG